MRGLPIAPPLQRHFRGGGLYHVISRFGRTLRPVLKSILRNSASIPKKALKKIGTQMINKGGDLLSRSLGQSIGNKTPSHNESSLIPLTDAKRKTSGGQRKKIGGKKRKIKRKRKTKKKILKGGRKRKTKKKVLKGGKKKKKAVKREKKEEED